MKPKHTPGPWRVTAISNNMIDVIHNNNKPGAITRALCRVQARQTWLAEADANARLIACAPELLEALQLADAMLSGANMNANVVEQKVKTAIAKATGEKA